jgi:hypothetical protein
MSLPGSNSPPPPQTVSPSALHHGPSSLNPRYESAIDLDTQTGLSPPSKRVKTSPSPSAEYPDSEEENWEDESAEEAAEGGDSQDEDESSDGEYILGLPRAQPNSNRITPESLKVEWVVADV